MHPVCFSCLGLVQSSDTRTLQVVYALRDNTCIECWLLMCDAGMAAHMQDEYEAHMGAEHVGRGYGAEAYGMPARGHFHTSSTQSITGLAQQQEAPKQQVDRQHQARDLAVKGGQHMVAATAAAAKALDQAGPAAASLAGVNAVFHAGPALHESAAAKGQPQHVPDAVTRAPDGAPAVSSPVAVGDVQPAGAPAANSQRPAEVVSCPVQDVEPNIAATLAAAAAAGNGSLGYQPHQLPAQRPTAVQQVQQQHLCQQQQQQIPVVALPALPGNTVDEMVTQQQGTKQLHVLPVLQGVPVSPSQEVRQQHIRPHVGFPVVQQQHHPPQQQQLAYTAAHPAQQVPEPPAQQSWFA